MSNRPNIIVELDDKKIESNQSIGAAWVFLERMEQLNVKGRTLESDAENNKEFQLGFAASDICFPHETVDYDIRATLEAPKGWDPEYYTRVLRKSYKERLIIAGALIAAEIDRLYPEVD